MKNIWKVEGPLKGAKKKKKPNYGSDLSCALELPARAALSLFPTSVRTSLPAFGSVSKGVSKAAQLLSRYTHVTLIHYLFRQARVALSHRGIEADLHHADEGRWICASWKLLRDENESETNRRRQRRWLLLCCWRQEGHQNVNMHFFYHAYKKKTSHLVYKTAFISYLFT